MHDDPIPSFYRVRSKRSKLKIIVNDFDTFTESLRQRTLNPQSKEEGIELEFHRFGCLICHDSCWER